jgi:hypothetical protein
MQTALQGAVLQKQEGGKTLDVSWDLSSKVEGMGYGSCWAGMSSPAKKSLSACCAIVERKTTGRQGYRFEGKSASVHRRISIAVSDHAFVRQEDILLH